LIKEAKHLLSAAPGGVFLIGANSLVLNQENKSDLTLSEIGSG
jgi:hypothetical protein